MPFLTSFAELKDFANTLNPLNVFSEPASTEKQPNNVDLAGPIAVAGPGPSTQALSQHRSSTLTIPNSESRPVRPSLKANPSSSASSFDDDAGRRRSSGTSVVIVDPIDGSTSKRRNGDGDHGARAQRNPRSNSVTTGLSSSNGEPKRKRKAPLDTYIIVRPPPTSAKNPLNLQIQLVVKETRTRDRSVSGVSLRSASASTDASNFSAPVTPTTPNIGLPAEPLQSAELSSSAESKPRSESPSQISTDDDDKVGATLKRSSSIKSNDSSNTSSTGTFSGSKKRVEPMFNLAVHNVMHSTVVTDASTDVKVAKFLKRALEVNGVGILEPSEVWLPPSNAASSANLTATLSVEDHPPTRSRPLSVMSLTTPLSPTGTRLSDSGPASTIRNSLDLSMIKTSMELKNLRHEVTQEGGAKKFFGKMFRKKPSETGTAAAEPRRSVSIVQKRSNSPPAALGEAPPPVGILKPSHQPNLPDHTFHSHGHATFGTAPVVVRRRSSGTIVTPDGAVTGLTAAVPPQPTAGLSSSPTGSDLDDKCMTLPMLPSSRPVGYTWSVKKWSKKNSEGWAAHLVAAAAVGLDLVNGISADNGDDEVLFEWVKLRVPSNAVGSTIMRKYSATGAISGSAKTLKPRKPKSRSTSIREDMSPGVDGEGTRHSLAVLHDGLPTSLPPSPAPSPRLDPRPEPVRRVSASVSPSRRNSYSPPSVNESDKDHDNSSVHTLDMTAEEDSDPEDSETPWTCSVWVKKTGQRQLLGTLTPAPHHPKVIAALKIPMSLENVLLTDIKAPATVSGAQTDMAKKVRDEICLTEENLKDVVCVTAMWLVAREEFGGLGRKKRGTKH